jgi:OmpA-OmpF porin, OOP family
MNSSTLQASAPIRRLIVTSGAIFASGLVLLLTVGCSTKNYVRSQTTPIIQQTNELDTKTAADHRAIQDTDARAQAGIAGAQAAAGTADQHAMAAGQSADTAGKSAQEAYNRVDSLSGVVANLDNYTPLADVNVTFAFDKYALTAGDKEQLDNLASTLQTSRGYILEVTGGTDSIGDANYNYQLSQRRADAVANYLQSKYNIPPHKFYLVGIGKDLQVASDNTAAGRAQNRRVEIKLLTNRGANQNGNSSSSSQPSGQ